MDTTTQAVSPLLARLFDSLTAAGGHAELCRRVIDRSPLEQPLNMQETSRVLDAIAALPWFADLTEDEQRDLVIEACATAARAPEYTESRALLETWSRRAHHNAKWRRFEVLRHTGVLTPPAF